MVRCKRLCARLIAVASAFALAVAFGVATVFFALQNDGMGAVAAYDEDGAFAVCNEGEYRLFDELSEAATFAATLEQGEVLCLWSGSAAEISATVTVPSGCSLTVDSVLRLEHDGGYVWLKNGDEAADYTELLPSGVLDGEGCIVNVQTVLTRANGFAGELFSVENGARLTVGNISISDDGGNSVKNSGVLELAEGSEVRGSVTVCLSQGDEAECYIDLNRYGGAPLFAVYADGEYPFHGDGRIAVGGADIISELALKAKFTGTASNADISERFFYVSEEGALYAGAIDLTVSHASVGEVSVTGRSDVNLERFTLVASSDGEALPIDFYANGDIDTGFDDSNLPVFTITALRLFYGEVKLEFETDIEVSAVTYSHATEMIFAPEGTTYLTVSGECAVLSADGTALPNDIYLDESGYATFYVYGRETTLYFGIRDVAAEKPEEAARLFDFTDGSVVLISAGDNDYEFNLTDGEKLVSSWLAPTDGAVTFDGLESGVYGVVVRVNTRERLPSVYSTVGVSVDLSRAESKREFEEACKNLNAEDFEVAYTRAFALYVGLDCDIKELGSVVLLKEELLASYKDEISERYFGGELPSCAEVYADRIKEVASTFDGTDKLEIDTLSSKGRAALILYESYLLCAEGRDGDTLTALAMKLDEVLSALAEAELSEIEAITEGGRNALDEVANADGTDSGTDDGDDEGNNDGADGEVVDGGQDKGSAFRWYHALIIALSAAAVAVVAAFIIVRSRARRKSVKENDCKEEASAEGGDKGEEDRAD